MPEIIACFNILPAENAVLEQNTAVAAAVLGERHRAGIDAHAALHVTQRGNVRVTVEQNVSAVQRRQVFGKLSRSSSERRNGLQP